MLLKDDQELQQSRITSNTNTNTSDLPMVNFTSSSTDDTYRGIPW